LPASEPGQLAPSETAERLQEHEDPVPGPDCVGELGDLVDGGELLSGRCSVPAPFTTQGERPISPSSAAVVITCFRRRYALATVLALSFVPRIPANHRRMSIAVTFANSIQPKAGRRYRRPRYS